MIARNSKHFVGRYVLEINEQFNIVEYRMCKWERHTKFGQFSIEEKLNNQEFIDYNEDTFPGFKDNIIELRKTLSSLGKIYYQSPVY